MIHRIISGIGANSFGIAITIVFQLVSLPLFLHFWNLETYGKWLILSAIPSYLSMADLGMVTAAGNKMTMAMGRNNPFEANKIFQSVQALMGIICVTLALFIIPILLFAPLPWFENSDQRLALAFMSLGLIVSLFSGLTAAAYRSSERYALGTMLRNYVQLAEWLGCILGLAWIGNFAAVAFGVFIMRFLGCIVGMIMFSKISHKLTWGLKLANFTEIKSLIKPGISFMASPLANALSFQGVTILVGSIFGPVSLALFSTYRTIARIAVQVTAILSHALGPEFSILYGRGLRQEIQTLFFHTSLLGALQAVFLSLVIYFLSPWMLRIWTHNVIYFEPSLMLSMLVYAAISGIWHIPRELLLSTNQHIELSLWILLAGFLTVGLSWFFSLFYGLVGIVIGIGLSELMVAVSCIYLASRFILGNIAPSRILL